MAYMKGRHVMAKNMEQGSTTSKMATSIKVKCIKESCKARESILGPIKMYTRVPSSKIK